MTTIDRDLAALQEARDLIRRARFAAQAFAQLSPQKARQIAEAVCAACVEQAEHYARWAAEETRIGNVKDKVFKNLLASRDFMAYHRDSVLGGIRQDREHHMLLVGEPAGVVLGLVPSTSPIATMYFKVLSCLLTRNAVILSPHPLANACSKDAARYLAQAAQRAGAPADVIQIQELVTLEATHALMRDEGVNVILATGGAPMVRAAYSSGNPALGVGPGNVPVYVDASAELQLAAHETIAAKDFDHGSPCSSPSVMFVHRSVAAELRRVMQAAGAHFCSADEQRKLEEKAFPHGHLNPLIVGRPASWIAAEAGLGSVRDARILVGALEKIDASSPMAREKLSPILGFKVVDDVEHAIRDARAMLAIAGAGHTSGVFASDAETAALWGAALNVNRTIVNRGTSMGVVGDGTFMPPTFTVGTGFAGRSSVGENVGPEHLINWKRIAFPKQQQRSPEGAGGSHGTRQSAKADARIESVVRALVTAALADKV
ncbi:MAG: aldehyde dehydrogenase family protein [Burkholderiaceae bacterium]